MDYETPDGSNFSLREVWTDDGHTPRLEYTSVTAVVDGVAYACRFDEAADAIDEFEISERLKPVPPENIYPLHTADLTVASHVDAKKCYLKAPSFMYEDSLPNQTFVADCLRREAQTLQHLRAHPHRNIVPYHGCVINKDGRISALCLGRLTSSLTVYLPNAEISADKVDEIIDGVIAGAKHLHSLGLAHNDLNPDNICIDGTGSITSVIVDFDSCLPFGERLMKGTACSALDDKQTSAAENDFYAIDMLKDYLLDYVQG